MSQVMFIREGVRHEEYNSGQKHPDFDDSVITDIKEFYLRFAADPDFRVRMLPPVYDIDESPNGTALTDSLLDADEPEFGEQDLEYFDDLRRQSPPCRTVTPKDTPQDTPEKVS